jgi:hypothetical protein
VAVDTTSQEAAMPSRDASRRHFANQPSGADALWAGTEFGWLRAHRIAAEERIGSQMAEVALERRLAEAGAPARRSPAATLATVVNWLRMQAVARFSRPAAIERPAATRLPQP